VAAARRLLVDGGSVRLRKTATRHRVFVTGALVLTGRVAVSQAARPRAGRRVVGRAGAAPRRSVARDQCAEGAASVRSCIVEAGRPGARRSCVRDGTDITATDRAADQVGRSFDRAPGRAAGRLFRTANWKGDTLARVAVLPRTAIGAVTARAGTGRTIAVARPHADGVVGRTGRAELRKAHAILPRAAVGVAAAGLRAGVGFSQRRVAPVAESEGQAEEQQK
jgi:hypothetical protein